MNIYIYINIALIIVILFLWQSRNNTKITIKSKSEAINQLLENNRNLSSAKTEIQQKYSNLQNNLTHITKIKGNRLATLNTNDDFLLLEPIDGTYVLYDPMLSNYRVGLINFSNSQTWVPNPESTTLYIHDIYVTNKKYENRGYGTTLLNHLFDYAKSNGFKQIKGKLAQTDQDHHDKLIYFYQKRGFEVVMGKNHTGSITKTL